ncbi:DUF4174 domain-containing protein [Balneola sp. MJW-20]|uniref:DUF4174 domain-containing protein n=1 Tax=Gracilimonas aurantiaca TaxID=3234185 RepID=UPI00390A9B29
MRTFSLVLLFSFLSATPVMSQTDEYFDLNDYRWKNRVLLIFSPNASNADYRNQMKTLKSKTASDGLKERDLKVFRVIHQRGPMLRDLKIPEEKYESLRARYSVDPYTYTMVLIGKDGGEKERFGSAVQLSRIFERIDEMPMRKLEIDG